jgi:uncharacterized protein YjbI with pentapeptide repeats
MKLHGADRMEEPEILDIQKTEEVERAPGTNYRGKDFSGQDLSGQDFSQADLRDCRLVGANLEGDAVPPAVRLVGLLGEEDSADKAKVLVETAKQAFSLAPDKAIEAIEQGTEQAEQLSQLLGS